MARQRNASNTVKEEVPVPADDFPELPEGDRDEEDEQVGSEGSGSIADRLRGESFMLDEDEHLLDEEDEDEEDEETSSAEDVGKPEMIAPLIKEPPKTVFRSTMSEAAKNFFRNWVPDRDVFILIEQDEQVAAEQRRIIERMWPRTEAQIVSEIDLRSINERSVILPMPRKDVVAEEVKFISDQQGNRHAQDPKLKVVYCIPIRCADYWRATRDSRGRVNPKSKVDNKGRTHLGLMGALNKSIAKGYFESSYVVEGKEEHYLEKAPLSSQVRWRSDADQIYLSPV